MKRNRPVLFAILTSVGFGLLPHGLSFAQEAPPAVKGEEEAAADDHLANSAYSVIPSDVFFALAVRSYKDLKTEGDRLIKESGIIVPIRPSAALDWLFDSLKVRKGLDEDAPFAVMLTRPDLFDDPEESIVYAVPFLDKAAMAENFGRVQEDFEEGIPVPNLGKNAIGVEFAHVALRDRWFYVGSKESILKVLAMKPVSEALNPDQRKLLPQADIVLHFARAGFAEEWERDLVREMEQARDDKARDERVQRLSTVLLPLAKNFRIGEYAIRVDDGLALQGFALFEPAEGVTKALDAISGGPGASHLTALPQGPVVAGFGATGDGRMNGDLARDLLYLITDDFFGRQGKEASVDRNALFGIFDEVWTSLRGSRGALYENPEPEKHGLYSVVSILDTDGAVEFLTRIQDLALYVNHASDQLDGGEKPEIDQESVNLLIEDLAAADFRVRVEASTRLALLGDAALPFLKKAAESEDPEVRMRATALYARLENLSRERGKQLIKGDVFAEIRPRFIFFPKAETRGEHSVDIAQLTLGKGAEGSEDLLRELFGPDWKKIRLIQKGDQVVFFAGSDTALLDRALANLDGKDPGIEAADSLKIYRERSVPVRKAELHTSMARILPLLAPGDIPITPPDAPQPAAGVTPPLTSAGLSIQPASLAIDLFLPPSELGMYYNLWIGW